MDISVPLMLNYHSGGIRVDEEASWVGLGWSLMAGGVITRTVRGGDDLGDAGYPDSYIPTSLDPASDTYVEPTDPTERQYDRSFLEQVVNGMADSEPDAFVLNFNGRSAKFFLNKRSSPTQPVKATLDELQTLAQDKMVMQESGFLYVYTSNESAQDVYFDNLAVITNPGPLMEETHIIPMD